MATGPDDDTPRHDVLRGLAGMGESLDLVDGVTCWSLSDDEARAALAEAARLKARAHAAYLELLAESARRDTPAGDKAQKQGAETTSWLAAECRIGTGRVRADLHEAKALDPVEGDLRALGAQLRAGQVSAEHTGIAVRALGSIPARIARDRRADIDTVLTDHATRFAPPVTRKLATHLLATIAPDRAEHFDPDAHLRRELHLGTDSTGMLILRGQLEPAGGAAVKALLDHLSAPHRGPAVGEGEQGHSEIAVTDTRTPGQRHHVPRKREVPPALVEMARLAAGNLEAGVRAGEPPRVVVHTTPDQVAAARSQGGTSFLKPAGSATCEQSGPISPTTLARLACDAVIDRIVLAETGKVLAMETLGRFFTPA